MVSFLSYFKILNGKKKKQMDAKFEQFRRYNDESFEEAQNVVYKSMTANDRFITFECRAPKGSILLADPVLETVVNVSIRKPTVGLPDPNGNKLSYLANDNPHATVILQAGAHPIQGICQSVVHRMGPIVIEDKDVYKWAEDWTALNYCAATKRACDATGTSPF